MLNEKDNNSIVSSRSNKKKLLIKMANLSFWLLLASFVVSLALALFAYAVFTGGYDLFPYKMTTPIYASDKNTKDGYQTYILKYPDYTNRKSNGILDSLLYVPVKYTIYTFTYPSDWTLKEFNSFQTIKPGPTSQHYKEHGSPQISVRKDYYIETHGQWLQNPDHRTEEKVSFKNFTGTHETADDRQNWSLFYKNKNDFEYHFNLSPRSPIGDKVLQDMVDSFEVQEIKIKVPWLMYPLSFGYQVLAIVDIIFHIL